MADSNPDRSKVFIPENWQALPWVGAADTMTIRTLGALVSDTPVKNRNDAVFAIQAEVDRREAEGIGNPAAQPAAPPEPEPAPASSPPLNIVTTAPAGPSEAPQPGAVLKQGSPPPPEPVRAGSGNDVCRVRITKQGHGKVFTGRATPKTYDWQAEVALPRRVARELEGRGYGEILD